MTSMRTAYKLVCEVKNPAADRRYRRDLWRQEKWEAGTVFYAKKDEAGKIVGLSPAHRAWDSVPEHYACARALIPHLVEVPEKDKDAWTILQECSAYSENGALAVLENMLRAGRITGEDIRAAYLLEEMREQEGVS